MQSNIFMLKIQDFKRKSEDFQLESDAQYQILVDN